MSAFSDKQKELLRGNCMVRYCENRAEEIDGLMALCAPHAERVREQDREMARADSGEH